MVWHVRPEYNYVDISRQQKLGDLSIPQVGSESASTSIFQLCWPVGLFRAQEPAQKTSYSLKQHQQKAFLQHSAGVASMQALKAVFLPIPQYVHMCHILLNSEIPEVLQLLMSQDGHIGFSKFVLLLSPVPISMVV